MKLAITGPMCSGKTTIANIIQNYDDEYSIYSFGGKVKQVATDLFGMKDKDRTLLINIAKKMKEIDNDIWIKYVMRNINNDKCIIDDLWFQNEINHLSGWKIISLTTPKEIRIERLKKCYPTNYEDHIRNIDDSSELCNIQLPKDTIYIDTSIPFVDLKNKVLNIIKCV